MCNGAIKCPNTVTRKEIKIELWECKAFYEWFGKKKQIQK